MGRVQVFRVETKDHHGPFMGDHIFTEIAKDEGVVFDDLNYHGDAERFPNAENETEEFRSSFQDGRYVFGFRDVAQCCDWFTPGMRLHLERFGFQLVTYEVDEDALAVGRAQVAFDPSKADPVGTTALTTIH